MAKKLSSKKKISRLPPPPDKSYSFFAKSALAKKPFLIALIVLGLALLFLALFSLAPQFVGKAIAYFAPETLAPQALTPFTLTINADIAEKETVAAGFILTYPSSLELNGQCAQAVHSLLPAEWGDEFKTITCQQNGRILFQHATLNFEKAKTGNFNIASVSFKGASMGKYVLHFESFEVIDLNDPKTNLIDTSPETILNIGAVITPAAAPSGGGGGGRGRTTCLPDWSCQPWSSCVAGQQTRLCTDKNNCGRIYNKPNETQACPCQESWLCSDWSSCANSQQTRTCTDEHQCGTILLKPALQKACAAPPPPPPVYVPPPAPPPTVKPIVQAPQPLWLQLWNLYKAWILLIPSILILLVVILFLFLHFHHPKVEITNIRELEDWISLALKKGVPKERIRGLIRQHTHWSDPEIDGAFAELRLPPAQ